jgi:tetratricopeptide (TPR) repeat protein
VLTVRGETPRVPGGAVTLDDIDRLKAEDAKALFLREARDRFAADPALPALLAALAGHPLSIVLMAAQTDARSDLAALAQDWETRRSEVLARGLANDRLTSVRVSLGLSLDRLAARPDAKRLLGLVALLPTGLQDEDIATLLPDARPGAARELEKARLVETRNERLTMLAPLRETAREAKLATPDDESRAIEHFLAIAADGNKIGWDSWPTVRDQVTREAGNLDAICVLALNRLDAEAASPERLVDAMRGLGKLNSFGLPAEVASLLRARALPETEALLGLRATALAILGYIALRRSDNDTARARYEEARRLFERVGDLLEQGICIQAVGDIALQRSDHDTARTLYEEAKPLFERVGSLNGQANCIRGLGDIALARPDHDTARTRYEEARPLYERVGDLLGQANCIKGLGDIAFAHSDHDTARAYYDEARPLYERVGDLLGQANCIRSLGDIALERSDHDTACARYEEALALYARIPDPYPIGATHLALMQTAASDSDRERHREAARAAWASIGRQDLIAKLLDAL